MDIRILGLGSFSRSFLPYRQIHSSLILYNLAFADCGIYPFDPQPVMGALEKRAEPIPELEMWNGDKDSLPSTSSSQTSSPKTVQRLTKSIEKINREVKELESTINGISSSFTPRLGKVLQGSQMQAHLNAQRREELDKHLYANTQNTKPRTKRQVKGLSQVGVLTIKDANRHVEARQSAELKQKWRKMDQDFQKERAKPMEEQHAMDNLVINMPGFPSQEQENELFFIDSVGDRPR